MTQCEEVVSWSCTCINSIPSTVVWVFQGWISKENTPKHGVMRTVLFGIDHVN